MHPPNRNFRVNIISWMPMAVVNSHFTQISITFGSVRIRCTRQ